MYEVTTATSFYDAARECNPNINIAFISSATISENQTMLEKQRGKHKASAKYSQSALCSAKRTVSRSCCRNFWWSSYVHSVEDSSWGPLKMMKRILRKCRSNWYRSRACIGRSCRFRLGDCYLWWTEISWWSNLSGLQYAGSHYAPFRCISEVAATSRQHTLPMDQCGEEDWPSQSCWRPCTIPFWGFLASHMVRYVCS